LSFFLFRNNENATAMLSSPGTAPLLKGHRDLLCLLLYSTCIRNLDAGLGRFPSLSLHCQNFLIANISMISLARGPTARKRRQKNRSRNLTYCEPQKRCKSTAVPETHQIFERLFAENNIL